MIEQMNNVINGISIHLIILLNVKEYIMSGYINENEAKKYLITTLDSDISLRIINEVENITKTISSEYGIHPWTVMIIIASCVPVHLVSWSKDKSFLKDHFKELTANMKNHFDRAIQLRKIYEND